METRANENLLSVEVPDYPARTAQYFVHGMSPAMQSLERTIADIASTDIPVLLVGESGTGKEVAALEIHRQSKQRDKPFVKCVCSALTGDSISARLQCVNHVSEGEAANSGSLFLDGINYLDPATQEWLLHLLPDSIGRPPQDRQYMRIISSATRSLEDEMKAGRFREELYYRINGVSLRLPPLRDRKEDIPALVDFFIKKYASLFERSEPRLGEGTMSLLLKHPWPGNIRELENVARKIVALGDETLATHDLVVENGAKEVGIVPAIAKVAEDGHGHPQARSLKETARAASRVAERSMILEQLERTHWNRKRAARELQISYKALLYKLKQLNLDGSGHPEDS
jgi:two-component system response regulator AtoC